MQGKRTRAQAGLEKAQKQRKSYGPTISPALLRERRKMRLPAMLSNVGHEKKVLLTSNATSGSAALALNATGTIQALNMIQVGSSMFNRIGRRVELVSVRFCAFVNTIVGIRTPIVDHCRIVIVYDRQTNGAYPQISDVLADTDQVGANTTTSLSGINMNNRERFITLMDHRFYTPAGAVSATGVLSLAYPTDSEYLQPIKSEFRRLPKLTTHYRADSNPAVIGDIATGGLYVISLATTPAASEGFQISNWNVRLKYVDV